MASLFSSPKIPDVKPAVTEEDPAVKAAAAAEMAKLKKRRGWLDTIATGPQGVTGEAPVLKQKLGE